MDTGVVPSQSPLPTPLEPSWSTHCTLLAWLWLWGVQRSNIKSYECLVSFVPKCGLQVFPTSFSPVFYLPAPSTCLPTCCSCPSALHCLLYLLPFATCENLCGKFFARTLCSKQKLVLRVGFTQAPQAHQARPEQCSAVQAQATSAQRPVLLLQLAVLLPCHKLCQVSEARARGFHLASTLHTVHPCSPLSLCLSGCLSVPSSRWPGDKFQVLVKQVIKVDLSTMGSFYTLPATDAAASTAVASTAAAIVNRATF